MVDLAKEAFFTQNFDLAAEIFERSLLVNGPSCEVFLGLGDCYARSGQFRKAFSAYTNAFRLDKVRPEKLKHLVEGLVEFMTSKGEELSLVPKTEQLDPFSCAICRSLLIDPVTVPCGHSFCRRCLEKDASKECKRCKVVHYFMCLKTTKNNVVIGKLLEKLFPQELGAVKRRADGNVAFSKKEFDKAIDAYSSALEYAPDDHLIASNRSHAYASLGRFEEALKDAELAISIRPDWPKAYYRKGAALSGLGEHEEACLAYLQCLTLDPAVSTARIALAKELHSILSPIEARDLKPQELQQVFKPSHFALALSNQERRGITAEAIIHMKTMLKDSLVKAGFADHNCEASTGGASLPGESSNESNDEHDGVAKCPSAPTSRSSSPAPSLQMQRAHSLTQQHFSNGCMSPLSRKRPWDRELKDKDASPGRSPENTDKDKSLSDPPSASRRNGTTSQRIVDPSLVQIEDLECSLCFRLFYQPVATPCGHVFCRQCLDRSLDHSFNCPLCKGSLAEHLAERRQAIVETLDDFITTHFPTEYTERKKVFEEEMSVLVNAGKDEEHEIPIFVCSLSYPTVACPLHIFEPRYRLMIRQCMESGTRQFGMCTYMGNDRPFSEYGTMLEIRDVRYFPDGRSLVDTLGSRRFKVMSRGVRDGYSTAKVQFIEDRPLNAEEREDVLRICTEVYEESRQWYSSLSSAQRGQVQSNFGAFPEYDSDNPLPAQGPAWAWWMVAVLPLEPRAQLSILAMTSLRERLVAMRNVIQFLSRQQQG